MAVLFILSLISAGISCIGSFSDRKVLVYLSVSVSWVAALLSLNLLYGINLSDLYDTYTFSNILNFASVYGQIIRFGFRVDTLSSIWVCTTVFLCAFTNWYSIGYMKSHARFITYNNLFSGSMILFVSANNFLQMYVGWELITLFSYLLINYYYYFKQENGDIAFRIFILHKFGDLFFLISILLMVVYFGSFDFEQFSTFHIYGINIHDIIFMLLLIPISVKSAQLGFMHWLKNAMIAPTPASAFLHAATIVSAGVYLLIRVSAVLELSLTIKLYVGYYFMLTSIISAILAFVEYDIKRILAYSTCSKMGIMLTACCFGNYVMATLFFVIHAFSKCALFFCAGNISHALSNERDIRKMGGLAEDLPKTYSITILSTLLFLGVIPIVIDHTIYNSNLFFNIAIYIVEGLSVFYMIRMIHFVFHGESRLDEKSRGYLSEKNIILTLSTIALISANFIVRISIFMLPKNIGNQGSILQYLGCIFLFICCCLVYKAFRIDIASYIPNSIKLPKIEFSRGVQKFVNFQRFIEHDIYSKAYIKIVQVGRKLTMISKEENFCLAIGTILVLATVIKLVYEAI